MKFKYVNIMKTKHIIALLFALMISIAGCDKGFEELNKDPLSPTTLDPAYILAGVQDDFGGDGWHYPAAIVQQINLIISGQEAAGNHNIEVAGFAGAAWGWYGSLKQIYDIMRQLEGTTDRTNLYNMARIMKAWGYMGLVDTYGDVPFTEAMKAYPDGLWYPKYDKMEDIYLAIESEIKAATDALDATKDKVTNDMYFKGDIAKWKKLGNSLLLVLGMRYTKLNPTKAAGIVSTAVDPARGGVLTTNADNVIIPYNATQNCPSNGFCRNSTRQNWHVGRPLVDFMKNNNDPRMQYLICRYSNPTSTDGGTRNSNPADQIGCPYGYDPTSIQNDPLYPGTISSNIWKYSQVNRQTAGRADSWVYVMTAAQIQLLLADATVRGWISTGTTAQQYYENGITLVMTQKDSYTTVRGADSPITAGEITNYLAEPNIAFNTTNSEKALEQINTQYWAACFLNWWEAWSNYRRSGYPVLQPNRYPGADVAVLASNNDGFIHRMVYPNSEYSYNKENVEAASTRVGGIGDDNLAARVFWDIKLP